MATILADTAGTSRERRITWYVDDYNFVFLRYDQIEPRFVCLCVINEQWVFYGECAANSAEWHGDNQSWHTLELRLLNDQLAALRDGKAIFQHSDTLLRQLPKTGYVEISNTYLATCFDDVLLLSLGDAAYTCGDADGNQILNISDGVYLISYIFGGGLAPNPLVSGDCDCNQLVNISDVVYLISYIFGGGPEPCAECR